MSSFSSAQYAEAARAALDRLEPEMAADMARRAVGASAATRDAAAAAEGQELLAEALTALGEREGAAAAWRSSIAAAELVAPAAATVPQAERWLYLAQLLGGREALEAFEHGAEMLDACAGSSSSAPSSAAAAAAAPAADAAASSSVDAQRIGARCALAELWMTDLCDEDEAEARCEAAVAAAVAVGPRDPEALQALANLRVTQGRHAEAGAAMATAVDTMHSADATDARQGLQATDAQFNFEARVSAARVLLECAGARAGESDVGGGGVEAARAVEVVDALLARDANVIELWYVEGGGAATAASTGCAPAPPAPTALPRACYTCPTVLPLHCYCSYF